MTDKIEKFVDKAISFHAIMFSFPRYLTIKDKSVKTPIHVYDIWGEQFTINPKNPNIVSIPSLVYYFFNQWLFHKNDLALDALNWLFDYIRENPLTVLSIVPFGKKGWNISTLYSIAQTLHPDIVKYLTPKIYKYNSESCQNNLTFDYSKSILYDIDGKELEEFNDIIDKDELVIKHR